MKAADVAEGFPDIELSRSLGMGSAKYMLSVKPPVFTCLENGDTLSYGGYTLECILTPGHSPGHMCLYIRELKQMFLGDHVLFDITPNIVRVAQCRQLPENLPGQPGARPRGTTSTARCPPTGRWTAP